MRLITYSLKLNDVFACEAHYAKNPGNAENLINWGAVLLDLSEYHNGSDKKQIVQCTTIAVKKLEKALSVENHPLHHLANWYLGNAFLSIAFLGTADDAVDYHVKAVQYYKKAYDLAPNHRGYKQYLDGAEAAKVELQEKAMASGPSSTSTQPAGSEGDRK